MKKHNLMKLTVRIDRVRTKQDLIGKTREDPTPDREG